MDYTVVWDWVQETSLDFRMAGALAVFLIMRYVEISHYNFLSARGFVQ